VSGLENSSGDDGTSASSEIDGEGNPIVSGVSQTEEHADEAFQPNDQVVITMHVDVAGSAPLLESSLKTVTVQRAGNNNLHVLFDNHAITPKGSANNLEYTPPTAEELANKTTTFRLRSLVMDQPLGDAVFDSSVELSPYTISSTATVVYASSTGARRMADVTTIRSSPTARRALSPNAVDVIAEIQVLVSNGVKGAGISVPDVVSTVATTPANMSTIIIIGVGAFFGTAFVIAGTVFLVKSRWMRSEAAVPSAGYRRNLSASVYTPQVRRTLESKESSGSAGVVEAAAAAPAAAPAEARPHRATTAPRSVRSMVEAAELATPASTEDVDLDVEAESPSGASAPTRSAPRRARSSSRTRASRKSTRTSSSGSGGEEAVTASASDAVTHRKLRKAKRAAKPAPPAVPAPAPQ